MLSPMLIQALEERAKEWSPARLASFLGYCDGKSVSQDILFDSEDPRRGGHARIPPQLLLGILGKSLPVTVDSGSGAANWNKTFNPVAEAGARQTSAVVPLCRMVPTKGELKWPKVTQSDQGDEESAPTERTASAGTVGSAVCAALVEADHFWIGARLMWTDGGNKGEYSNVTEFIQSTHTLSFAENLKNAVAAGDKFRLYVNSDEFAEYGFAACDWHTDGGFSPLSEIQFDSNDILPFLVSAYTETSRALANRAPSFMTFMEELFRDCLYYKLERAILNGDGTTRPLGILQTSGVLSASRVAADSVEYADFLALEDLLPAWPQQRASWLMSKEVLHKLKQMAETEYAAWMQELVQSGYKRLLGHPIVATDITHLGDTGDVLFGDFSFYILGIEEDATLYVSDHHRFKQNRRCFMPTLSVGGKLVLPRSFAKLAA